MPDSFIPGPTPSGYQRTTGGQFRWRVPSVEELQTFFTQYEILDLLGRGGMGAVFRAHQKSLDRLVAIKVLPLAEGEDSHNFIERFKNEARTMARLDHPGIVHVHDFGETDSGLLYFVMEFIEGSDVQQMLLAQGVLSPAYALPITQHVCDALAYAHSQGVIHRDIKPANIMLTKDGRVKVADFGLARLDDPTQPGLTQTGMAMGTPDYVAPEALAPGCVVDSRADLYAIGVMLCHMLTGEVPRGMFELPSERNGALDPRIDGVITKAMRQRPDERYQTAAALRADLDVILTQPLPSSATVMEMPQAEPAPVMPTELEMTLVRRRLPFHWSVVAGLGLAVAVGAFFLALPKSRTPDVAAGPGAVAQPAVADAKPPSGGPALNPTKWLPFAYPADFGKIDGGVEALEGGGVTVEGSFGKRLRTSWTHQDIAVRARISLRQDGVGIIGLRTDLSRAAVRAVVRPDRIEIVREVREDADATDQTILRSFAGVSRAFYEKQGAELVFAVLGNEYHLWQGETFLGSVADTLTQGGKTLFDGVNATFRDMQWQVIGDITATPQATQPAPLVTAGVWVPVRFPDDKPPRGEWRENTLSIPIRDFCHLPVQYSARDAALRAKVTVRSGDGSYKGLYFKLRNEHVLGFFNLNDPFVAHVGVQPDLSQNLISLASSINGAFLLGKQDLLVEFAAVGDDVILAIEGKVVAKARSTVQASGKRAEPPFRSLVQAGWNTAMLRDLEFISLDGVPSAQHPEFIKRAATFAVPVAAKSLPAVPPVPAAKSKAAPLPAELAAVQKAYANAIAERVTQTHDTTLAQLNSGFLAALERAVSANQLSAAAIQADKAAVADKKALPPDGDATPEALKTLRATYRAKASEIDDARTATHLSLLTPYVTKLRELEATLGKAGLSADAEAVKAHRDALSENPLALPEAATP